jgi:hypothetical protein
VSVEPGIQSVIVEYGDLFYQRGDGQIQVGNNFIVDEKTWGELCTGYRCAWCLSAQSVAWPEKCEFGGQALGMEWHCADEHPPKGWIRDYQMEFLANELKERGNLNAPDPYDVLDVEAEDWRKTKTGIVIPRELS